jgi:hypothetical protein
MSIRAGLRILVFSVIILGGSLLGQAAAAPAVTADVDWSDSGPTWLDSTFIDAGNGTFTPHVVYSSFKRDLGIYRIEVSTWNGSAWGRTLAVDNLLQPPLAVVAPNGSLLDIGYIRNQANIAWARFDPANPGLAVVDVGPVAASNSRPAIAIRSDGRPAFAYERADVNNQGTWVVSRPLLNWTAARRVDNCGGGFPSVALDGANLFRVACLGANGVDVKYVIDQGAAWVTETALGNGADVWAKPHMLIAGGVARVAAIDRTTNQLWYAERSGANNWQRTLVDQGAHLAPVNSVRIAVAPDGTIGIAYEDFRDVWYVERPVGGAFTARTALNRGSTSDLPSCAPLIEPVALHMPANGIVQASWSTSDLADSALPNHLPLKIARFAQWARPWTLSYNTGLNPIDWFVSNYPTSLAVAVDGTPWACYYKDSSAVAGQIDLFVRQGSQPPLLADANVGLPGNAYARGCDIAVSGSGKVVVVYGDYVAGVTRVLERSAPPNPVWAVRPNLQAAGDPAQAVEHLAVRFDGSEQATIAYSPFINNNNKLRLAKWNGFFWTYDTPDPRSNVGAYLDITFDASDFSTPLISYYGIPPDGAGGFLEGAWFARRTSASPVAWQLTRLSGAGKGYDTSVSSRVVGGSTRYAVSYYDYQNGGIEVATFVSPNWVFDEIEPNGLGDFTAVKLDVLGKPMTTYRWSTNAGTNVARVSRWSPYAGGRVLPADPDGTYEKCSFEVGGYGTSLALDVYDNLRVTHKQKQGSTEQTFKFFTRP